MKKLKKRRHGPDIGVHYQTTATGKILLPESVSLTVKPSKNRPGRYNADYSETLPTTDVVVVDRTVRFMKDSMPNCLVTTKAGKKSTAIRLRFTASHDEVGARMAGEFMAWSLLGKASIMELIMIVGNESAKGARGEFVSGVDPRPKKPRRKKARK